MISGYWNTCLIVFLLQPQDEAPSCKESTPTLLTCTAVTHAVRLITLPSHHQHNPQSSAHSAHECSCARGKKTRCGHRLCFANSTDGGVKKGMAWISCS